MDFEGAGWGVDVIIKLHKPIGVPNSLLQMKEIKQMERQCNIAQGRIAG